MVAKSERDMRLNDPTVAPAWTTVSAVCDRSKSRSRGHEKLLLRSKGSASVAEHSEVAKYFVFSGPYNHWTYGLLHRVWGVSESTKRLVNWWRSIKPGNK